MSALRFLFVTLLLAVDSVLSPEGQRINIRAEAGQDSVTLPCGAGKEKEIIAVEWRRPDLYPDDVVLLYRDGRLESEGQHESFKNRVHLQDGEMKDGNASLILKNVTIKDAGTYECRVQTDSAPPELISTIHLVVSPPGTQEGGGKERRGKEGGDEEGASSSSLGLIVGIPVSVLCVLVGVAALIYSRKPACLQRFRLCFRQPPLGQEPTEPPKPAEPEPEPDEIEMSLLSSPSEPPDAGPSSTSGTQTAASSPEHPAHPE
ncbi:butyrophilin subfamily 2 member A1-like [Menidia menidia]